MSTVRELMNDWGRGFLAEKFGAEYQQSGEDITFEQDNWDASGCETCGPMMEYEVEVADWPAGKYATYTGRFTDLIDAMSKGGY